MTNLTDFTRNAIEFNQRLEESVLTHIDMLRRIPDVDQRWLSIGKTHIQQAFMALNRAVIESQRPLVCKDEDSSDPEKAAKDQPRCD
jgi:hypothetical protein